MFDKLKAKLGGIELRESGNVVRCGEKPNLRSIYESRSNFGVNFGSLFVLEKYIFGDLFVDGTSVELDAIKEQVKQCGIESTRAKLEKHWKEYCSEQDWQWLQSKGIQSIRVPVGYWHIDAGFTKGTNFESIAKVYENAWAILKQCYIEVAARYRISVLVDLHALPFGANTGDHSGELLKAPGFWGNAKAQSIAVDACKFIASEVKSYDNISGIQIVNESCFDNEAKYQKRYYFEAINAIRSQCDHIPIVISDGWWADQWTQILSDKSHGDIGRLGIVIDEHVYRCFSDDDKSKNVDAIIGDLSGSILQGLTHNADFIIGEYSCVLDTLTWDKSKGCQRDQKVIEYGQRQSQLFKERCMGSYFWTFKFQYGDGGEWGLVPMVNSGAIPSRNSTTQRIPDEDDYNNLLSQRYNNHADYWMLQNGNTSYEFWRFKDGFTTAWFDCLEFMKFDNSKIGRLVAWKYARKQEHIKARGSSEFVWQWEHGFDEAITYFNGL